MEKFRSYPKGRLSYLIQHNAFINQGRTFSFGISYLIRRDGTFWERALGEDKLGLDITESLRADLPEGVTMIVRDRIQKDGKTVYHGKAAIVDVPENVSKRYLNKFYGDEGYAFRDYLLKNHRCLIEKYAAAVKEARYYSVSVNEEGIEEGSHGVSEYPQWLVKYSDDGMARLDSFNHIYGMLLAIWHVLSLDINGLTLSHYGCYDGTAGISYIDVALPQEPKSQPQLSKW